MKKALVFFCLLVLVFLSFALLPVYRLAASWNWQKTSCTIISSRLESRSSKNSSSYKIKAMFSYRFNDKDYTSENFDFSEVDYGSEYEMKKFISRYQPGQQVECFVNPENPNEAVVYRSILQFSFTGILIASCLFLFGLFALVFGTLKFRIWLSHNPFDPAHKMTLL